MGTSVVRVSGGLLVLKLFPGADVQIDAIKQSVGRVNVWELTIHGDKVPDVPVIGAVSHRDEWIEFVPRPTPAAK